MIMDNSGPGATPHGGIRFYDLKEVSKKLRISPGFASACCRLIESGGKARIPLWSVKVGRRRLWLLSEIQRWIVDGCRESSLEGKGP